MKQTFLLLAIFLQAICCSYAQTIPVSTGLNAALTASEPIGNNDPYWKIASSPNPPGTPAKVSGYFSGAWEPTPVGGTLASWINVPGNPYGYNTPGIYVFERDFNIAVGSASFSCDFSVAYDDALVSLELVNPSGGTTALTVTPTTSYHLSLLITNTILSPAGGTWKIRATVNFIDNIGGFLLSGYIKVAPCRNSFVQSLQNMGGSAPGIFDDPAGGLFVTGLLKDSTVIIKTDGSGNILWIQKFLLNTGYYQIKDLKVDNSGDLLAIACKQGTSWQSTIFRCNATATAFSWIKVTNDATYSQLHILNTADFIVTASNSAFRTHLERRNKTTGNVSTYTLEGEAGDYYSTLDNGNLYGTCRRYYNAGGDFRTAVFSHNANTGAFQWQNAIISRGSSVLSTDTRMYPVAPAVDNANQALAILSAGDLIGFDQYNTGPVDLVAAQTTQVGNVNWTNQYLINGYDRPNAVAILNTSVGYYMVATLYLASLGDFGFTLVIKTDKAGNVLWARRLGISGRNIAATAVEKNGSLYLSLASDSYAANDLMIVKLDAQGNSSSNCSYITPIQVTAVNMQNVQDVRNYSVSNKTLPISNIGSTPSLIYPHPNLYCETACNKKSVTILGPWFTTIRNNKMSLTAQGMAGRYLWSTGETTQSIEVSEPGEYYVTVTDRDGDVAQDCHTIIYLGSDERKAMVGRSKIVAPTSPSTMALSPNPAHSVITLKLGTALLAKANVNIADQYGRIVYQGVLPAGTKQTNLSIAHLPAAMYYVTIHTADKKSTTVRVIKQ